MRSQLRVAVAGVGNCASSLVQGVHYYSEGGDADATRPLGLITPDVCGLHPGDIEFSAAFDIDERKVGRSLAEAISAPPNCSLRFSDAPDHAKALTVEMAPPLDGIADHMSRYPAAKAFRASAAPPVDVAVRLRETRSEILICYLPVGSTQAVRHFAEAALSSGVGFVNCVPVFIANDSQFADRFSAKRLPLVGDDVRSQVGATIIHQRLVELMGERGYQIRNSYQINVGGNTDFLNMLDRTRLTHKKESKTNAVLSKIGNKLAVEDLHVGPSDYIPHLLDQKTAFIRVECEGFGRAPLSLELRLSVEDSPNSAGVVLDAIRYAGAALRLGIGGVLDPVCSYYMKSPPRRLEDGVARRRLADLDLS